MPLGRLFNKSLITVVALSVVALAAWLVFLSPSQTADNSLNPDQATPAVPGNSASAEVVFPVETGLARRGDLIKLLQTTGTIRANREVEIVGRIGGEIVSITASNGRYVQQGELLVKLDEREYRTTYDRAASALLAAQIEYRTLSTSPFIENADSLEINRRIIETQRKLREAEKQYREGEMTREDYERAKRDYETDIGVFKARRSDVVASKSGLSLAREAYERAKMNLEWTEIRAPFAGYVADCALSPGTQIQIGKVLMKLVDVSRLLVDVEVLEGEIGRVRLGSKADASVNAYPEERFTGRVATINPIVDAKSKTVKVTIELGGERGRILRPGMFATVRIETEIYKARLLVSKEALLVRDQRTLVFVAEGGLAKWHYVEIGEQNEEYIEIKSGIAAGDTVIIGGHYTLAHDARIKIAIR